MRRPSWLAIYAGLFAFQTRRLLITATCVSLFVTTRLRLIVRMSPCSRTLVRGK